MLASALEHYRLQQRLSAGAVLEARRRSGRGTTAVVAVVTAYQLRSVSLSLESTANELAEQGISAPPVAVIQPAALLTSGSATAEMLAKTANQQAFDRLIATLIQDAGRTASALDTARRPAVTGYIRALNPPSCSRCAVLAGRFYRWSDGFQRHPYCDCIHVSSTQAVAPELITDPTVLIERGQIRGLSKADLEAIELGADLGQVVNVRRKQAGLTVGSSVMDRAGRPTPAGILRATDGDRDRAIALLRRHEYLN